MNLRQKNAIWLCLLLGAAVCVASCGGGGGGGGGTGGGGGGTNTIPPSGTVMTNGALTAGSNEGVSSEDGNTSWLTSIIGGQQLAYSSTNGWGAVFVVVNPVTSLVGSRNTYNLSQYSNLVITLKGAQGGESVQVGVKTATDPNNGLEPLFTISNLTTSYQAYTIPLASLVSANYPISRFSSLYVVCEFVFTVGNQPSETIDVSNISFQ